MCWLDCLFPARRTEQELQDLKKEMHRLRTEVCPWSQLDRQYLENKVARQYECKVCFSRPISTAFLPCGHAMACEPCTKDVSQCPFCSLPIETITRLHLL